MTDYESISQFAGLGNPLPTETLNRIIANEDYFRAPPSAHYVRGLGDANYTVTTTEGDIDTTNMTHTIVTTGGVVWCYLYVGRVGIAGSAGEVRFELMVDGVDIAGGAGSFILYLASTSEDKGVNIAIPVFNLSAGSHTFKWRWVTSAGTATMYAANYISSYIIEKA